MKECIIEMPITGECVIDIDKVIKKWTLLCRIKEHNGEYRLIQLTPKGKTKFICTISKKDALKIIQELKLDYYNSKIFNNVHIYAIL